MTATLKDAVRDTQGQIVFDAPDGSQFHMPPGGDPNKYIRKGYAFVTKQLYEEPAAPGLRDGDWSGCRCFIVGGGPSLKGFDFSRLDGELTIGINRAIEFMTPTVSFSLDSRWWRWTIDGEFGEEATRRYKEFKGHKVMVSGDGTRYDPPIQQFQVYPHPGKLSSKLKHGLGHGDNSGFAALNLALCLGASEIYLLGFDMDNTKERTEHWHDGYPGGQDAKVYGRFMMAFMANADEANSRARIINCNPDSALKCFEFGDLPEIKRPPIYVSGYTPDYEGAANSLIESLDALGLEHDVRPMDDAGGWLKNCAQKPGIIRDARKRHKGRAVVWIDSDAKVRQSPVLFQHLNGADFAAHTLGDELLSGTVFFAATNWASRLLTRWQKSLDTSPEQTDQQALADALQGWKGERADLPAEYCRIFDNPSQANAQPIIEHYQHSRGGAPEKTAVFANAQLGFGDNLNQRPFVRDIAIHHSPVYVQTPVPEIFWDIPGLRFVRPDNKLRTQTKNEDRAEVKWHAKPEGIEEQSCLHSATDYNHGLSVPAKFAKQIAGPYDFEFHLKPEWIQAAQDILDGLDTGGKPICLVKRPTVREEWSVPSRNPDPEYYQTLLDAHKDDYFFISIHDIEDGKEWFVGELDGVDAAFDKGELPFTTICGLAKLAGMILCYPSFMMLLGIAVRSKTFAIYGGLMRPGMVVSDIMGLDEFAFVAPHPFCECQRPQHACNKDIPEDKLLATFDALRSGKARKRVTLGLPAGIGDLHWVLLKLEAFKRKNDIAHLKIVIDEDDGHKSSIAFLRKIPFIDEVEQTPEHFPWVWKKPAKDRPMIREDVDGLDMLLEFNSSLEQGHHIETILPEYSVNWRYSVPYEPEDRAYAQNMREVVGGRLVVVYASSVGANESWAGNWTARDWERLCVRIRELTGSRVVLIGAKWDAKYSAKLKDIDSKNAIHNLVGRTPIARTLALIREAELLIGLASGMPIMATHFRTPTIMMWPDRPGKFDHAFQTAWVNPSVLRAGEYVNLTYGRDARPENVLEFSEKALRGEKMRDFEC